MRQSSPRGLRLRRPPSTLFARLSTLTDNIGTTIANGCGNATRSLRRRSWHHSNDHGTGQNEDLAAALASFQPPPAVSAQAGSVAQAPPESETRRISLARTFGPDHLAVLTEEAEEIDEAVGRPAVCQSAQPPPSIVSPKSPTSPTLLDTEPSPSSPRQTTSPMREAFSFLTRGRKKSGSGSSGGGGSGSGGNGGNDMHRTLTKRHRPFPTSSTSASVDASVDSRERALRPSPHITTSSEIAYSGPTEVLNPTSKLVSARCKGITVTVEIFKETSASDFLVDCSRTLAGLGRPVDPDDCVVIEPCARPGLERRLRQYERVWDVVSAWDHDTANTFIILPDSSDPDEELVLSSVPDTQDEPEGFVLPIYHLYRPGKWTQRYITLKENGQVFASKKREWKVSDKDVTRLCHLSDFDIYMPTEAEMRKQLRPPKRYCYAIRSQEKATLFIDSSLYVQFFCTDDPNVARQFRSAVQGWRSWYLVNRKLRLHDKKVPSSPTSPSGAGQSYRMKTPLDQGSRADHVYRGRTSLDQGPRGRPSIDQLPLVHSVPSSHENAPPGTSAGAGIPPIPPLPGSLRGKKQDPFAASGLLGNDYEERRQHAVRREGTVKHRQGHVTSAPDDGPFTDGPNLLNGGIVRLDDRPGTAGSGSSHNTLPRRSDRTGWFPSAVQHSAEHYSARPTTAGFPTSVGAGATSLARRPSTSSHVPTRNRSVRQPQQHGDDHHIPIPPSPTHQQPQPLSRSPQQPLVDLTPGFIEAPQWSRENRGRGVRAPQGKPLVDLATGPVLPPSRIRDAAPPKNLVRRPDAAPTSPISPSSGAGGTATLMQQYETQKAAAATGATGTGVGGSAAGRMGGGSGLVGSLARRNTTRSMGGRGVVAGGETSDVPAVPGPTAAYLQARGGMMGVGERDKDRVREWLRNGGEKA
ncbi:uncharacterized protein C8A04DRAFT_13351 [Dichotomopilus funicola]|uniref:PH domain-containing protein n=1 Tax=Dichotomopilus funicola TaxID=1934379 RepID=A0AAN6V2D9_9PEZI|nr:hypothetical protein C8A04DRAFT_13351 [Dichotomopilus funicola]